MPVARTVEDAAANAVALWLTADAWVPNNALLPMILYRGAIAGGARGPLGGNHAQLTVAGELGGHHLDHCGGQPRVFLALRQIGETGHRHRRAHRRLRGEGHGLLRRRCRAAHHHRGDGDGHYHRRRDAERRAMPAKPLRGAIAPLIATRRHRLRVQPAPHIGGEGGNRRVARLGNLAQRLHDNRIERPAQPVAQRIRRSLTGFADRDRRLRFAGTVGVRGGLNAADRGARPLRLQFAHHARNLFGRAPVEPKRTMPGQHFVHQQAERVDVTTERCALAGQLGRGFGARHAGAHRERRSGHERHATWFDFECDRRRRTRRGPHRVPGIECGAGCEQHRGGQ